MAFLGLRSVSSVVAVFPSIRSSPRLSCRRVGAIVAGSSWVPPACLSVRAFVSIVCCLLLFVYIVP